MRDEILVYDPFLTKFWAKMASKCRENAAKIWTGFCMFENYELSFCLALVIDRGVRTIKIVFGTTKLVLIRAKTLMEVTKMKIDATKTVRI